MDILTPALPGTSFLWSLHAPGDFLDCYATPSDLSAPKAAQVFVAAPAWANGLMQVRNLLVRPFGLKPGKSGGGNHIGPFPVVSQSGDEVVLGFDDSHLNFRLAFLRQSGLIHAATWVRPHNFAGRVYLAAVLPFHKLILRDAMRRLARA